LKMTFHLMKNLNAKSKRTQTIKTTVNNIPNSGIVNCVTMGTNSCLTPRAKFMRIPLMMILKKMKTRRMTINWTQRT